MTVAPERTELSVRPIAGHIGADIDGVDLSRPLDEASVGRLTDALHRHKVIFFRDQELDHAGQIRFARHFGELTYAHPHDDAPPEGYPEIFTVDPRRYEQRYGKDNPVQTRRKYSYFAGWHTDVTAAVNPPAGSILRAETVPEFGGDTSWTSHPGRTGRCWTCSTPNSPGPNTPCGSAGARAAWRSGTTGPPPTSRRPISTTSTWRGPCTG